MDWDAFWGEHRQRVDAWREAARAREVEISVVEDGGFNQTLTSIDDLLEIPPDKLPRIGVIDIEIGGKGYSPTSASISVSRRNGLEVRAAGRHRSWTAGLRHEVEDILTPRVPIRPRLCRNDDVLAGVAGLSFVALFLGIGVLLRRVAHWPSGAAIGVAIGIAVFAAAVPLAILALPTMQLLPPGEKPRYQRWRAALGSAALALALSIVASIIVAVAFPSTSPPASHARGMAGTSHR